jgi:hypothetical protein
MNVYEYTALGNRFGSSQIVASYGMQPADNPMELSQQLAMIVARTGEEGLQKVMSAHPDASFFRDAFKSAKAEWEKDKSDMLQNHFSNANGQVIRSEVDSIRENGRMEKNTKDLLIIGGVIVLALAIIKK